VGGFGRHACRLEFDSATFDHVSELPAEFNAGNRFYGRDVAEFVSTGLAANGFDTTFFDEDWGWQAHARRPDGAVLEISIYHNPEDDPRTEDRWALMVRLLRKERRLGILTRFAEVEIDPQTLTALEEVFRRRGISLTRAPARSF
jgi:hypothetical protein